MGAGDEIIGRAIGNYVVTRKLGQGGMGAVYLARNVALPGTHVAVKLLLDAGAARGEVVERFRQEALAASAVGDHRIVRPIDMGRLDDGRPYILMEYVEGRSVSEVLKTVGPLSLEMALKITYRVADTMALAHTKGVIHRDLKPSNVMLSERGEVRLLDFGVARVTGDIKVVQTSERAVIGTPGYMSPEAAMALGIDGRADVFSLGVTLFEMLTGELPIAAPNPRAAMLNLLSDAPAKASARRPASLDPVPSGVDALIERALRKDPQERMTMAELRAELMAALKTLPDESGGAADHLSTRLSAVAPLDLSPHDAPTLSERSGEVAAVLSRLAPSPPPARQGSNTPSLHERPATAASVRPELPAHGGEAHGPPPRRGRWPWPVVAGAVLVAIVGMVAAVVLWLSSRGATPASAPSPTAPVAEPNPPARIPAASKSSNVATPPASESRYGSHPAVNRSEQEHGPNVAGPKRKATNERMRSTRHMTPAPVEDGEDSGTTVPKVKEF